MKMPFKGNEMAFTKNNSFGQWAMP